MLCAKFGWNWPNGSGEEVKNVKSLQTDKQTDGQTDDRQQAIRKAHRAFSSGELKTMARVEKILKVNMMNSSRNYFIFNWFWKWSVDNIGRNLGLKKNMYHI